MRRAALLLWACALGCGGRGHVPASSDLSRWRPNVAPGDPVVATVRGAPIFASQLAAHARSTGLPRRAALDDLVHQELLFAEARRRGYDRDAAAVQAERETMVRLFVAREFGDKTTDPGGIPEADLRPVYDKSVEFFQHERMARVWNVCTSPQQARAIYDDARAHPPADKQAFQAIARAHGATAEEVFLEETSRGYEEKWRKALFAAIHKRGDVMAPAHLPELRFPCTDHVAWTEEFLPPRHDSFEQARAEVAQKIWSDWRKNAFARWLAQLARQHQVEIHAENLPHE
jgi:hypothetical protein